MPLNSVPIDDLQWYNNGTYYMNVLNFKLTKPLELHVTTPLVIFVYCELG